MLMTNKELADHTVSRKSFTSGWVPNRVWDVKSLWAMPKGSTLTLVCRWWHTHDGYSRGTQEEVWTKTTRGWEGKFTSV